MRTVLVVFGALAAVSASAQRSPDLSRQQRAAQETTDAQAAGAAAAVRPGDEDLSCEALQTEMVAIAQSPAMQNFAQGFGAQAQADLDKLNEAQAAAEEQTKSARKGIFRGIVRGAPPSQSASTQSRSVTGTSCRLAATATRTPAIGGRRAYRTRPSRWASRR